MTRTFLFVMALVLAGCAGPGTMQKADTAPAAKPDQALIVFMRSTFVGSAISASVFDVSAKETKFVGLVNNGTKIGYFVPPGQHTFMVVSEAADFMQANVVAGKTYYALVTPRMGMWKARFSFKPVRGTELGGADFAGWDSGTQFVVNSPESTSWAAQNGIDIAQKRAAYWPEWNTKSEEARAEQTLNPSDGR